MIILSTLSRRFSMRRILRDLRAAEDRRHRARRLVKHLGEGAELLLHEEARDLRVEALANHARVPAVRRAERVVHVDVAERAEALAERLHLGGVGLDLLARRVHALA